MSFQDLPASTYHPLDYRCVSCQELLLTSPWDYRCVPLCLTFFMWGLSRLPGPLIFLFNQEL